MNDSTNKKKNRIKDVNRPPTLLIASVLGIALVVAAFVLAYQFVGPPPPDRIVLATGEDGGAYQVFGEQFARHLSAEGITVDLRATAGSGENLDLLVQGEEVDIAFVQGGLAELRDTAGIVALGSMYFEPLWVFVDRAKGISSVSDFLGRRLSVGAEGSGTRAVVLAMLEASGVTESDAELVDIPMTAVAEALRTSQIDAAFVIAGPSSELVQNITELPNVTLLSLHRSDALVRQFPFLSKLLLPEGVLNLQKNFPDADVEAVAVTAMLAANEDFHPALVDLLLVAAEKVHGHHTLLADAGTFPTPRYIDLPLNEEAERHYKYGPPFLMRYLPFWAATLVDRLWIMLLPLIGLAIPLVKLVPPAYRWRIRRRLLRVYAQLESIDPMRFPIADQKDRDARIAKLAKLENDPKLAKVPREYTDDVYKLRRDIDLVARRLART